MKRKEDYPLQRHTLHLFEGEYRRLQEYHPRIGAAKIIRDLVHHHLRKIEERAAQHRRPLTVEELEIELPPDGDRDFAKVTAL